MAKLELKLLEGSGEIFVEFFVDGKNLAAHIQPSIGTLWDNVLPWGGGDFDISDTVLGECVWRSGGNDVILFACGCGQYGCSCVRVTVEVAEKTITFHSFHQDVSLGEGPMATAAPIVFDREQFEQAVRWIEACVKARTTTREGN